MSLTYADKVRISRQYELEKYKQEILQILEDSKRLVDDCDTLVKMRALKTRCEKISKPRPSINTEEAREAKKRSYQENKTRYINAKRNKRQKIREIDETYISNEIDIPM